VQFRARRLYFYKNMAKRGRPQKLTPKLRDTLCEGLELGMGYAQASLRAGITERTRLNWVNAGKEVYELVEESAPEGVELTKEQNDYLQFFLAHEAAIAESQYYHLSLLENHAQTNPQVSQWILKHRFPDVFGDKTRIEHSGPDGGAVEFKTADMTIEERAARVALILQAADQRRQQEQDDDVTPDDAGTV
jgi:hypothetical protein